MNNPYNNFGRNQHNNRYQFNQYPDYNYHEYYGQNTIPPGQAWFEQNWYQSNYNTPRYKNRPKPQQYENNYNNNVSEIMLRHINKLKAYLENDQEIYLDFTGLNLMECDYVCNLHRLNGEDIVNFSYDVQPAMAELYDVLNNVREKMNIDVICEENSDRNLRNITYSKIFNEIVPVNEDVHLPEVDQDKGDEQDNLVLLNETSKEVKTIAKEELYYKPEFEKDSEEDIKETIACEWTDGIWQKSTARENNERKYKKETASDKQANKQTNKQTKVKHSSNKHINKMIEACSTPMEGSSKAERMMQLMGWQGGALGAKGDGILEPVVPSVAFKHGSGLGHTNAPQKRKVEVQVRPKKKVQKQMRKKKLVIDQSVFNTNVLAAILDFLIDDEQTELKFDIGLRPIDRKNIHCIIEKLRTESDIGYDDMEQVSLVSEIYKNMDCVLETESHGLNKQRQLHLYKAAQENVYLITPKDFENKGNEIATETDSEDKKISQTENTESITIEDSSEDETERVANRSSKIGCMATTLAFINQEELKNNCQSDTRLGGIESSTLARINREELKNSCQSDRRRKNGDLNLSMDEMSREEYLRKLLISYIVEFCNDDNMNELRFLGNFDLDDTVTINSLMVDMIHCVQSCQYKSIFEDSKLESVFENPQFAIDIKNKERDGSIMYILCKIKKT